MKREQRIVAIGAASGVSIMVGALFLLMHLIPVPQIVDSIESRLAYALGADVFALLPFFLMLITVGNSRFLSEAIDPTRHAESASMEIDGRVVENTLQQNFVFSIAALALSTVVPFEHLQIVWACAIVFVVARSIFWYGYRIDPLYRAPGMAATAYMNLGIIAYTLYSLSF